MTNMLGRFALFALSYGALGSLAHAGDLDVGITIRGEIVPGVCGRVDLGGRAPPAGPGGSRCRTAVPACATRTCARLAQTLPGIQRL